MSPLDDVTLIRKFVQGDTTLLGNQNLRVETAFDASQLIAKRGGIVATLKTEQGRTVLVRQSSEYWALLHQVLCDSSLVPTSPAAQKGFILYEELPIPDGYEVNYMEAVNLWKAWWTYKRKAGLRYALNMNLLVLVRNTWYPVQNIEMNPGTLFIKTWAAELCVQGKDYLVWLSPVQETQKTELTNPKIGEVQLDSENSYSESTASGIGAPLSVPQPPPFLSKPHPEVAADEMPTMIQAIHWPPPPPAVAEESLSYNYHELREPSVLPPHEYKPRFQKSYGAQEPVIDQADFPVAPEQLSAAVPSPTILPAAPPLPEPYINAAPHQEPNPYLPQTPGNDDDLGIQEEYPGTPPGYYNPEFYYPSAPAPAPAQGDMSSVLRFNQGRLYIMTAIGEVVVEGTDIKFWLDRPAPTYPPMPDVFKGK
ncbi:hypothetical protein DO97_09235 [Neosynechococcus sphagnicola sy1]|uniref:Uncharacterized protein n=1 Tax=Neosynechococcus sphagnicola sy1 TaxID=1497020 RepID=A0A098TJL2_9CYAN|nr:hypothetical protein [Neosynechococcus sphagnicola]KGF72381.1 hypothetical protein DO97_09235 [Neosynechococcus sphagnicola sy1]